MRGALGRVGVSDYPRVPQDVGDKAQSFPESSYGAQRVTLLLADGRRVPHVSLAGDAIVKVDTRPVRSPADLDFVPGDVVDAVSEV
jgi:hypothetical protein